MASERLSLEAVNTDVLARYLGACRSQVFNRAGLIRQILVRRVGLAEEDALRLL